MSISRIGNITIKAKIAQFERGGTVPSQLGGIVSSRVLSLLTISSVHLQHPIDCQACLRNHRLHLGTSSLRLETWHIRIFTMVLPTKTTCITANLTTEQIIHEL